MRCLPFIPSPPWSFLRHLRGLRPVTLRLESEFWTAIDDLAHRRGQSWREWVAAELAIKPVYANAASWLRVRCLLQSRKGDAHGV